MTNEQHNKYLAYSFFVYAGFQLFWTLMMILMMFFMFSSMPGRPGDPGPPMAFFGAMFGFIAIFQIIFTAPSAIAGYALLKRKKWARVAGIVGAVMSAMSVPIGTAVCVYAMWFLMGDQWKEVYENNVDPRHYRMPELNESVPWQTAGEESSSEEFKEPQPSDWR